MTDDYVEGDNIKFLLTEYYNWLITTSITKYFDEDLKSNSNLFINASTMKNYLWKVIIMFKYKFPNNCARE